MKKLRITLEGKSYEVTVELLAETASVASPQTHQNSQPFFPSSQTVSVPAPSAAPPADGSTVVTCPMAGKVFKCLVKPGDAVTVNQVVIVLDAMKMETPVVAPVGGTVGAVLVKVDDAVDEGQSLLQIRG